MLYQTLQVTTLATITQIDFFHKPDVANLHVAQGHYISVSVRLLLAPWHAVLMFTNQEKVQCVL